MKHLIDFDKLTRPAGMAVRNGYAGLDWFHLEINDDAAGDRSARNVWAEGSGFSIPSGSFNIDTLSLTAETRPHQKVTIFGWADGELVAEKTVAIVADHARTIRLDWEGVDTVTFNSRAGDYWHLDDIDLSRVVDDPASKPLGTGMFETSGASLDHALSLPSVHQDTLHHLTQLV